MRLRELIESATAGATAASSMATVTVNIGNRKRNKYGAPKAEQYLNPDGTVKNALDMDDVDLMGSKMIRR